MLEEYYLYLGYYKNLKIYFCTKDENLYADTDPKAGTVSTSVFAGISCGSYALLKHLRLHIDFLSSNLILLFLAIIGAVIGIVYSRYVNKKNHEHFQNLGVFYISDFQYQTQLIKQAKKNTKIQLGFEIFLIVLVVMLTIILRGQVLVVSLLGYMLLWFSIIFLGLQFRLPKRWQVVRKLKSLWML